MAKIWTTIMGYKVLLHSKNLKIVNSYKINDKTTMKEMLIKALSIKSDYHTDRTIKSLVREWVAHNRMYRLHLFRKHTRDCDFEPQQKIIIKIIYFILGV